MAVAMTRTEAKAEALAMLRRRIAAGWARPSIEKTIHEGAFGPGFPGYLITSGKISIPAPAGAKHEGDDIHTFRLSALLDELESPQGGLFA